MVYVSDTAITGQFGQVVALTAASTPFTAAGLQYIYNYPRSNYTYAKNTLFRVFDRTKKVLDQTLLPSAYTALNNAVAIPGINYQVYYGGYVEFNVAQTPAGGTANEVQTLTNTGGSGGTFTLTFDDGTGNPQTTAPIAWNATAANIVSALVLLTNIGAAGVTATGGPINTTPVAITFGGAALSNNPYAVMVVDNTLLTGGTIANAETTPGTSGFTFSGSYIPTSAAANVITLPETQDWKITKGSAVIKNPTYGTGFMRNLVGMAEGTFEFYMNAVDDTLYTFNQRRGRLVHLALYEKSNQAVPRLWLIGGLVTATPIDNPAENRTGGTLTGVIAQWPTLLREAV